jgi:DNA-directed RNA polymerase specialized sigma subunit
LLIHFVRQRFVMEIKDKLIEKVKSELTEVGKNFSQEEINSFLEWMKVEYRNYMMLTRENALATLQKLKVVYGDYIPLVNVLENNIEEYASLQCFYRVAMDGVNVA